MNPLISIIVPVYNVENYLAECLDSIINQSYSNFELIVVNDGSTDLSGVICDSYLKKDSRIKVIHKSNGGLSSARNAGLEEVTGDFIGFVDSDDVIDKDMYLNLSKFLNKNEVSVLIGRLKKFNSSKSYFSNNEFDFDGDLINGDKLIELLLLRKIDASVCSKLFKAELFFSIRFPEGKLNEDFAIIYRIFSSVKFGVLLNDCIYNYRVREDSITNSNNNSFYEDSFLNSILMIDYIRENKRTLLKFAEHYHARIMIITFLNLYKRKQFAIAKKIKNQVLFYKKRIIKNKFIAFKDKLKILLIIFFPLSFNIFWLLRKKIQ